MGKCKFNPEWKITFPWAEASAGDVHGYFCGTCVSSYSCKNGKAELAKHEKTAKHISRAKPVPVNPLTGARTKDTPITSAFKKAEIVALEQRKISDQARKAEVAISSLVATHNVSLPTIDCLAELLPKIFPDSKIVQTMSLHRTKATYTLIYFADNIRSKIVNQLKQWPFSVNYDESVKGKSSQLDIVVSYRNKSDRIQRSHLLTLDMKVSLTGKNISDAVYGALESLGIPIGTRVVSERTDGCSVMTGVKLGCHKFSKDRIPQLPDLGGCGCHDCCNCLKHGVKSLNPALPVLWKALYGPLEKASVKKTLSFMETCSELGMIYKHAPKYLEVRFRYALVLAKWCEDNDGALYTYFRGIAVKYQATGQLQMSENEATVCEIYPGDYIMTRLCHQFIVEAGAPFLSFIDFFERREVTAHLLFPKTLMLVNQHLNLFLKFGNSRESLKAKDLLKFDYKKPELLMTKKELFIGGKAREFIKKMGLTCDSPELAEFFDGVVRYYYDSTGALLKYCKAAFSSSFLSNLMILEPDSKEELSLPQQREMWGGLASQCNHIVSEDDRIVLLTQELVSYQSLEPAGADIEVDDWWRRVGEVTVGDEKQFPILSRLALSLCTVCPSGSEAERDFSDMEAIYSDPKSNSTGQDLMQAKMSVKSAVNGQEKYCGRCIEAENDRKERKLRGEDAKRRQCSHCQCGFLDVDDNLLAELRNKEPSKMFGERNKKRLMENKEEEIKLSEKKELSKEEAKKDFEREVSDMKKRFQDARMKALKEKKDVAKVKVPKKNIPIDKIEANKRKEKKLAFIFDSERNNNPESSKVDEEPVKKKQKVSSVSKLSPANKHASKSKPTSVPKAVPLAKVLALPKAASSSMASSSKPANTSSQPSKVLPVPKVKVPKKISFLD